MRVIELTAPPDKSISHRAVMLASISEGFTRIKNLLMADDVLRTMKAFRAMGVRIRIQNPKSIPRLRSGRENQNLAGRTNVVVRGVGMRGLERPARPLYLGNSGTTMRILSGILAGQDFEVILKGDASLSRRPMRRIAEPLKKMGIEISGSKSRVKGSKLQEIYPPLRIHGRKKLKAIKYKTNIASAQVKSCILLAGLYAEGITSVIEPVKSRDHTERMLKIFGCRLKASLDFARDRQGSRVSLRGPAKLKSPGVINIPGDISSAAFFITAGCILPDMKMIIKNVGLNPTRTGVIDILRKMGADIKVKGEGLRVKGKEPCGDIIIRSCRLKGVIISPQEVVRAIDEIPVIMVAACFADGTTTIRGIGELRVKETDRIRSMVTNLRKLGADVKVKGERLEVKGGRKLHGAKVSSFGDHRTAMSMLTAALAIEDKVIVSALDCMNKSFPGFEKALRKLKP